MAPKSKSSKPPQGKGKGKGNGNGHGQRQKKVRRRPAAALGGVLRRPAVALGGNDPLPKLYDRAPSHTLHLGRLLGKVLGVIPAGWGAGFLRDGGKGQRLSIPLVDAGRRMIAPKRRASPKKHAHTHKSWAAHTVKNMPTHAKAGPRTP